MCKYCKLEQGNPGERFNDTPTIGELRDGHQTIELLLNRYISEDDNTCMNELIVQQSLASDFGGNIIQSISIPIKYCPFCGEEF